MKPRIIKFSALGGSLLISLAVSNPGHTQIIPDNTLPNSSIVPSNCTICIITGGTTVGSNLFHSFEQFSIPIGSGAFFNNASNIEIIFTRVTGESASMIDGFIGTKGVADLFLLNPNGILFGSNASLNIGGSFIATSADSINFADGEQFSATNPQTPPLLSINVPIGLQFGPSPGNIRNESFDGLAVTPGKTIALVGGSIDLPQGALFAEDGRIELGSVGENELVSLTPVNEGWQLSYDGVERFQDIRLFQEAFVDTSGDRGGDIQVYGRDITVTEGSQLVSTTLGSGQAGDLRLVASDTLEVSQSTSIPTGLFVEVGFPGDSQINATASSRGGNLIIEAQQVVVRDAVLSTSTFAVGDAGDLFIGAERVIAEDLGQISASTNGEGNAGNLTIDASESVELIGGAAFGTEFFSSGLFAQVQATGQGDAGDLTINTRQLTLADGAQIVSAARNEGSGGEININASEFVRISGAAPNATETVGRSGIFVSAEPSANQSAGSLALSTPQLIVEDRGEISANNFGASQGGTITLDLDQLIVRDGGDIRATSFDENTGRAGNLDIRSEFIFLDGGRLTAETRGQGGANIQIQDVELLFLDNQSLISAQAFNDADGGNITINAANGFIVAVPAEDSDIVADANQGNGGNINIATQGLFGLEFRPQRTSRSDITANSLFGRAGTVTINQLDVDPSQGLTELPEQLADPSQQIAQECAAREGKNEFTVTGRGGLPPSPTEVISPNLVQDDLGTLGAETETRTDATPSVATNPSNRFVEAQGWIIGADGKVILTATASNVTPHSTWQTPANCQVSQASSK